jgi:tetratricopeptide (TPR) repeat protein
VEALNPTLQIPEAAYRAMRVNTDPLMRALRDLQTQQQLRDPKLIEASAAIDEDRGPDARKILTKFLAKHPRNADAHNLMAELARRKGILREAEFHLAQCARWAPDHEAYRYNYVVVLNELEKLKGAVTEIDMLLEKNPSSVLYRTLKGHLLNKLRRYEEAEPLFRELSLECPDSTEIWMGFANTLRALGGHSEEAISCMRKAAELDPASGGIWWSMAAMKTFRFTEQDVRIMEEQLAKPANASSGRTEFLYALGKACDDLKQFEKAFQYYSKGNAIRRVGMDYNPDSTSGMVSRAKVIYTPELFRAREQDGCPSAEPIFVVSLQRSGSTLTEQILGAHSQIEVAGELQTLINLVGNEVMPKSGPDYPNGVDKLTPEDLRALGEKYLQQTKTHRTLGKPFFVDKNCYNIWQVGLIRLILPNAKIIDVRRHPISCCWANFTVSFSHAPPLSYKLTDIGRFYYDYVRLMAHFDRVQPGKIHRVIYENLVADLEGEVRRMLDFLELPFEQSCLEYYKVERAFNSFSNEQVRQPIFKDGVERWRSYEPWLGPLKAALGPVLDVYPNVPEFAD